MPQPERRRGAPGHGELFAALPVAVVVIDPDDRIAGANMLAEQVLNLSARLMLGQPLAAILPPLAEARRDGHDLAVFDTEVVTARGVRIRADFVEAEIPDYPGWRTMTLHGASASRRLGDAADRAAGGRAAIGVAAMLAHEIRNPLSGIRGAAQLIGADGLGGELPTLITTEVDRIAGLIDRMQEFGDTRPLTLSSRNIYPLLAHARNVALAGFARGVAMEERFDPSLPPARVNPDALLQIVINLLKNAAQAVRDVRDPRIVIATGYRHGMVASVAPGQPRLPLPIEICVIDNGPGAPAPIAQHLFDPFISGRPEGQGLGLALVDKLMRDMGGLPQYGREGEPPMTVLRLLLPRGAS